MFPPIGFHVRKSGFPSLMAALDNGADLVRSYSFPRIALQTFSSGPRGLNLLIKEDECEALAAAPIDALIFHGSYADIPWTGSESIANSIVAELAACKRAGGALNIHLMRKALEPAVRRAFFDRIAGPVGAEREWAPPGTLYLETNAEKFGLAYKPAELNAIFDDAPENVGLCIDTAHVWACGGDISTKVAAMRWLSQIRTDIPIMIHLNDSYNALCTGSDAHAAIGEGQIWKAVGQDRPDGYLAFIEWAAGVGAPLILERNVSWLAEVKRDLALLAPLVGHYASGN